MSAPSSTHCIKLCQQCKGIDWYGTIQSKSRLADYMADYMADYIWQFNDTSPITQLECIFDSDHHAMSRGLRLDDHLQTGEDPNAGRCREGKLAFTAACYRNTMFLLEPVVMETEDEFHHKHLP